MLKVENLNYSVREKEGVHQILKDVSFELEAGEMLVITGPNGSGKSTLAKVLMGIYEADSGKVLLDGEDISSLAIDERAKAGIGFAFQQPPRFKGMTVEKFINLSSGEYKSEAECCDLLSRVGLCAKDYIKREVDNTLSGGEMKRLEIASVLSKGHKLCIFDEPEAGIDLWSFSMLIQEFEEIKKDKSQSIIIISHQERIMEMADRVMVIDEGSVAGMGKKDELLPLLLKQGPSCCAYLRRMEELGK